MIPVAYNVRNLGVRKATTLASALGLALVVFVFAGVMMLNAGINATLGRSGRADVAIVLRKGSDAELSSSIEENQQGLIAAQNEVKKRGNGLPMTVSEIVVVILQDKLGTDGMSNVTVRGVNDHVLEFRPSVKVVEGKAPAPGSDEVMVGKAIHGRFKGMKLGESFELKKNRMVKVVGVFTDGGSSHESEVWGDMNMVRTSFGREGVLSSVRVQLESPAKFDAFKAAIESNRQLGLTAQREDQFFEKQSEGLHIFVSAMGFLIAFFFSIGAMIGAMITMHAAVANRQREIGTLRALGFSRLSILSSFLLESIFLALIGGVIGVLAALPLKLASFSMMNQASWSELVIHFEPTPQVLITSVIIAAMMGIFGGFLPAIRAARMSPIAAMRGN